jgi:hypothetical protein
MENFNIKKQQAEEQIRDIIADLITHIPKNIARDVAENEIRKTLKNVIRSLPTAKVKDISINTHFINISDTESPGEEFLLSKVSIDITI